MIARDRSWIFFHRPKTGGNSIQKALLAYSSAELYAQAKHHDLRDRFELRQPDCRMLRKHSGQLAHLACVGWKAFSNALKFTVIRNPYDRLISLYFSPHAGRTSFEPLEFAKLAAKQKPLVPASLARASLAAPHKLLRRVGIDHVLRFENLEHDFKMLASRLSLTVSLEKTNVGPKPSLPRHEAFPEDLKLLIERKHRFELVLGGFEF